jgi:DNA-directed RNA polymerase specialized sigma24 family protein
MTPSNRNEFVAYVHYLAETELEKVAYRLVKDRADAADVVRETVDEALRREAEFDATTGTEGLKKWVLAICTSQAESYRPSPLREQIPALSSASNSRRSSYDIPEEREDPLLRASRTVQLAAERKGLSRTGLGDASDENEFARRLSKSAPAGKTNGQKHTTSTPAKSNAFTARTRQRQADNQDRSRQFFDDLLNNILASREEEAE